MLPLTENDFSGIDRYREEVKALDAFLLTVQTARFIYDAEVRTATDIGESEESKLRNVLVGYRKLRDPDITHLYTVHLHGGYTLLNHPDFAVSGSAYVRELLGARSGVSDAAAWQNYREKSALWQMQGATPLSSEATSKLDTLMHVVYPVENRPTQVEAYFPPNAFDLVAYLILSGGYAVEHDDVTIFPLAERVGAPIADDIYQANEALIPNGIAIGRFSFEYDDSRVHGYPTLGFFEVPPNLASFSKVPRQG